MPTVVSTMVQAASTVTPTLALPTKFEGDAGRGEKLFKTLTCGSCHVRANQGRMIAPELTHIATEAQEIILRPDYHGQATTPGAYIFESFVNPNAFVLPPYDMLTPDRTSLMPKDFEEQLTTAQIQDLVEYLMTLR
jgi:mono/diheme cytochrome c family protein